MLPSASMTANHFRQCSLEQALAIGLLEKQAIKLFPIKRRLTPNQN